MGNPFKDLLSVTEKPTNFDNYGPYRELAMNGRITINTSSINTNNWNDHYNGILNIMKDSIETEFTQNMFITIIFADGIDVDLTIMDYWINLIFWYLNIRVGDAIESKHLYFNTSITKRSIKNYIDNLFIDRNRRRFSNMELNIIIDDAIAHFNQISNFAMFFANTINLEDTITIMREDQEFYECIHADLSAVPIEDVKAVGMDYTNKAISRMKNARDILGYDHCLANSWRANEGINSKQFKEFSINIGSKPDGQGGVFPAIINKSFITGGVNDALSYFIESSAGRYAQIMMKMNVGNSGYFARLLGLNNMDTILHQDPNYTCNTKHFVKINITSEKLLEKFNNRYYRENPKGIDKLIKSNRDIHLIGQTIYLRSPMTCASAAAGHGICYKCYGDLAYTNNDINIGRIASEEISAKLTQRMLSAKHLLETAVKRLTWVKAFFNIFEIEANEVKLQTEMNYRGWKMIIDPECIELENEEDYNDDEDREAASGVTVYNEYLTEFIVESPEGKTFSIHTEDLDKLYISTDLNNVIRNKAKPLEDRLIINMTDLTESSIFYMIIQNNELSKTLDRLKDILNKNSITKSMDINQILQAMLETLIEGDLDVSAVHGEVILSNQIRSVDDILEKPTWYDIESPYQILTLHQALSANPSITVTLSYQNLGKILYNPLTYRKHKPSFMDLFFMKSPQDYLNSENIVDEVKETDKEENIIVPGYFEKKVSIIGEDE